MHLNTDYSSSQAEAALTAHRVQSLKEAGRRASQSIKEKTSMVALKRRTMKMNLSGLTLTPRKIKTLSLVVRFHKKTPKEKHSKSRRKDSNAASQDTTQKTKTNLMK